MMWYTARAMREPCDICRKPETMRPLLEVSLSGVLDATIGECAACGFRQVRPRLERHELSILYPSDYFDAASSLGFSDYHRQQQRAEREAYFLARRLRRIAATGRLLEVGCALGFLLDGVRRFCGWEVTGIDVSEFGTYFARRMYDLDVRCATLEEARFEDESFDFIVQKDLLEHVSDPRAHLEETARVLRRGGHLWIVTPNGEGNIRPLQAIAQRLARTGDDRLPRLDQGHVSFFRMEHLRTLFAECDLEITRARNIDIRRGVRALCILPRKKKAWITGPSGNVRGKVSSEAAQPDGGMRPDMAEVYGRVRAQMDHSRKPLRSSAAYFHFRQISTSFDTLPGFLNWGNDFDFLLRRR